MEKSLVLDERRGHYQLCDIDPTHLTSLNYIHFLIQ